MSAKIQYTDEPMDAKVVPDFLPPPDQLQLQEDTVEVTLTLSKQSVMFFQLEAAKKHMQYQHLMRQLLEQSAAKGR
ncbi:MAG TPA: CopG family transcriptional regulator [Burkholderiaceae bacterium]|nr:CopG family transcriptional regulator [Burkholderiaceae bacterium]